MPWIGSPPEPTGTSADPRQAGARQPMRLETGQEVLHYRVLSLLGAGGGGEVWVAEDLNLGRRVALKVLPPDLAEDPQRLRRFDQEARALAALNHPNIVTIHSIEQCEDLRLLTMELVEGETLRDLLERETVSSPRLLAIAEALASALVAAHERGVVHRDLKPGNVMITPSGQVKVLDFGLARMPEPVTLPGQNEAETEVLTRHGMVMGTCPYMAPEQIRGRGADARSDLFALGAVLYEMATREPAFGGDSAADTFAAVLRHDPPPVCRSRPDLPPELDPIVGRCLAKDPDDRYQTAAEVHRDLAALRREIETAAALGMLTGSRSFDVAAPPPAARRAPRGRRIVAWTAVAALVVAATLALLSWRTGGEGAITTADAVAVLPFANLTGDPSLAYLSEGISAGVISRLGEVSRVRVLGRSESWRLHEEGAGPVQTAKRLGVAALVEGEMQGSADRLQVNVQLADGRTGLVLWSESFEGTPEAVFDLQQAIARSLSQVLGGPLSFAERRRLTRDPTGSFRAYKFYLQGRQWLDRTTVPQSSEMAVGLFREALGQDPEFALAHAGLSHALWTAYHLKHDPKLLDEARREAERAVAIAPDSAEAHVALARILRSEGRYRESIDDLRAALVEHSRPEEAYLELAANYEAVGELGEAETCFRLAVAVAEEDWSLWNALGSFLVRAGRYEDAREAFRHAASLAPEDVSWPQENLATVEILRGNFEEAVALFEALDAPTQDDPELATNMGTAYFFLGRLDQAEPLYQRAVRLAPNDPTVRRNLADLYAHRGEVEKARAEYRQTLKLVDRQLADQPTDPTLQVLRALMAAKADECDEAVSAADRLGEELSLTAETAHKLASVYALCGEREAALEAVGTALERGFAAELLRQEDEFRTLRDDPEFLRLVGPGT